MDGKEDNESSYADFRETGETTEYKDTTAAALAYPTKRIGGYHAAAEKRRG